jgi:Kef-type K+ transport system membrane component KefB
VFRTPAGGTLPHAELSAVVQLLAKIGVILLMFVAGMETDLGEMPRVGKVAFWAAFGGVVLPLAGGAAAAHLFSYGWGEGFFMGAVLTAAVGRLGVSEPVMAFVVVIAFLYAWAAEYLGGVAAITGSYMAGVLFAQWPG